jgi:hypothetical protein
MNFTQTCSIAHPSGAVNALNENTMQHGTPTVGISCLYATKKHETVNAENAELVSTIAEKFYFPAGTDVRTGDEITAVKFANGDSVTSKRFIVQPSPVERIVPTRGRLYVEAMVRSIE